MKNHFTIDIKLASSITADHQGQRLIATTPDKPVVVFDYGGNQKEKLPKLSDIMDTSQYSDIAFDTKREKIIIPMKYGRLRATDISGKDYREFVLESWTVICVSYNEEVDVYVACSRNKERRHTMCIFDPEQSKITASRTVDLNLTNAFRMCFLSKEMSLRLKVYVIVSDRINHCVKLFNKSGKEVYSYGSHGTGEGQLQCPMGVCLDPSGRVLICDRYNHRVQSVEFLVDGETNEFTLLDKQLLGGSKPIIVICDPNTRLVFVLTVDNVMIFKDLSHNVV